MKKIILLATLCAFWFTTAYAGTYESQLGFSIVLPSNWVIINKKSLKNNPATFNRISNKHRKEILEGKIEFYENSATSTSDFKDNIYVYTSHDENPKKYKAFEKTICDSAHDSFSTAFGKDVKVYNCKIDRVSDYDVIYMDFDGALEGTRNIQYQIWKPSDNIVIMTLTCKNNNLSRLRKEFDDIVKSFKASK